MHLLALLLACAGQATSAPWPTGWSQIPDSCDDALEPNDTIAEAVLVVSGVSATVIPLSLDHWLFAVPPGERATVTVQPDGGDGATDVQLLLPSGRAIDGSTLPGDADDVVYGANLTDADQLMVARVWSTGDRTDLCSEYTLSVELGCTELADRPDERSQASPLTSMVDAQAVSGDDWDWYTVDVDPGELVTLQVRFASSGGPLAYQVWNTADQLLDEGSSPTSFPLVLDDTDGATPRFVVGLQHADGGCNLYELDLVD